MSLINGKGTSLVRQGCTVGRLVRALSKRRELMGGEEKLKLIGE